MKRRYKYIKLLFLGLYIGLLIAGWFYESPHADRQTIMLVIGLALLMTILVMLFGPMKHDILRRAVVISSIIGIALLEYYAKYAIDYFFHSLYIVLIIYVLVFYAKKEGILIAVVTTIVSYIKFVQMLWIQPNIGNLSLFIFYLVIQILVLIVAIIARNYYEESRKTNAIYLQLLDTYKQLELSSKEIERLSMEEERTKIARDLHDTLGHDMTGLIMQIEMGTRLIDANQQEEGLKLLEGAKKSARDSMAKVRQIVQTLKTGEQEKWSLASLNTLTHTFSEKTGVIIELNIEGDRNISPDISIGLYRLIQESLTNSVRHGKAKHVRITITFDESRLYISIQDNGTGCKQIKHGNGLKGMEERIQHLGGSIEFICKNGFRIRANIPYYN
ncbi:MAG: sensor histidine kinase [Vallitaleaceae bacterium]|jgi:signal transduction histidine kinase|nr:sensor histidine kinase [Vallitaleaceae bacterium]